MFSAAIVWSFTTDRKAEIQFNSPFGDTIFQISRGPGLWKISGSDGLIIEEDAQGILTVNGHKLPLKSDEIGCILSGTWPSEWLNTLTMTSKQSSMIQLSGEDDIRQVDVEISLNKTSEAFRTADIKSCAVLKWGGAFGFFKNIVSLCRKQESGAVSMRMSGINEYIVDWTLQDE